MRNLLALVGLAVIAFAGAGWYLNWYTVKVAKTADGNLRVQTDLDTNKVVQDGGDGLKRVGDLIGSATEKGKDGTSPAPANTPAPKAGGGWLFGEWEVSSDPKGTGKR